MSGGSLDPAEGLYAEYLQWCIDRANWAGMPVYFAMQMPLRLASACLPMARRAVLDPAPSAISRTPIPDASTERLDPRLA